jgi:hypothetical protein
LSRFWAFDAEKIFNWSIPKEMLTFSTMETKADNHEVHEGARRNNADCFRLAWRYGNRHSYRRFITINLGSVISSMA